MNQLKITLQSKYFLLLLFSLTIILIIVKTKIITYHSIYNINDNKFVGIVDKINKNTITLKSKENLIIQTDEFPYQLGDKIEVIGKLNIPKKNTIPNTFNYQKYLYNQKIFYTLNPSSIKLISKNKNIIYKIKTYLENYFNNFKSKDILNTLLLGNLSILDNNIYNSYQENGISHLLSISGIHISFIILILSKIKKKKNILYDFFLLFLISFIFLLTNKSIPILRILIYQILSILNKRLKLNINTINLFYYSIIIPLIINPFYIYQKGFLYSYSISFILIKNKDYLTGNYFIKILKISFISFLFSIPLNIYYNYSINLLSIIFNIIYVPIFSLIILPLVFLTPIVNILDYPLFLLNDFLNKLSIFFNNISFGIIILKKINIYILIIYYIIFYFIIKLILNKSKKGLIILFLLIFIHSNINNIFKDNYYLTIDVSQGDSSLVSINNYNLLIDTGGLYNKEISKNTITMLKSFGINKIDTLLLTHGDYDHMGEAINLVENFKVEKVIFNCGPYNDLEKELIKVLDKKKIKYKSCINEFNLDKTKFYLLQTYIFDNENDNSNVLYFELNKYKFLLMGDASTTTEKEIMNKYNLHDIDVLKVGHHGSKTSSSKEFINEINPKYSVISVGKNNRYGHPNKEVLSNLEGSKIYRTDDDGSVVFKIKNNNLKIETCSP